MRYLTPKQIAEIRELIEEVNDYRIKTEELMEEYKAIDTASFAEITDVAEAEAALALFHEVGERVELRVKLETEMVSRMAEKMDLDLDCDIQEQLEQMLQSLEGNRRLSGTLGSQRKVAGNRKASRRRRR